MWDQQRPPSEDNINRIDGDVPINFHHLAEAKWGFVLQCCLAFALWRQGFHSLTGYVAQTNNMRIQACTIANSVALSSVVVFTIESHCGMRAQSEGAARL